MSSTKYYKTKEFICELCGKESHKINAIINHMINAHNIDKKEAKNINKRNPKYNG